MLSVTSKTAPAHESMTYSDRKQYTLSVLVSFHPQFFFDA